jgi:hypothetical protein
MNATTALPKPFPPDSNLNADSETSSNTRGRRRWFRQECPTRMPPTADWTAGKVLTLDEMCERYLRWMLSRCGGNRAAAAQLLGIGRTSLYRYLEKLDLEKRGGAASNQLRDRHLRSPQDPSSPKCEPDHDSYATARNQLPSWKPQLIQALFDLED